MICSASSISIVTDVISAIPNWRVFLAKLGSAKDSVFA
jgi:hypothetical protein